MILLIISLFKLISIVIDFKLHAPSFDPLLRSSLLKLYHLLILAFVCLFSKLYWKLFYAFVYKILWYPFVFNFTMVSEKQNIKKEREGEKKKKNTKHICKQVYVNLHIYDEKLWKYFSPFFFFFNFYITSMHWSICYVLCLVIRWYDMNFFFFLFIAIVSLPFFRIDIYIFTNTSPLSALIL